MTRLDQIRQRLERATAGPWGQTHAPGSQQVYSESTHNPECSGEWVAECATTLDQDLIANAPTDLKLLLDVVERAIKGLEVYASQTGYYACPEDAQVALAEITEMLEGEKDDK